MPGFISMASVLFAKLQNKLLLLNELSDPSVLSPVVSNQREISPYAVFKLESISGVDDLQSGCEM